MSVIGKIIRMIMIELCINDLLTRLLGLYQEI